MTAIEYFSQLRNIDSAINRRIKNLDSMKETARALAPLSSGDVVKSSSKTAAPYTAAVEKIIDEEKKINEEIDYLVEMKISAVKIIETASKDLYREVLVERFINGRKWKDIAADLSVHEKTARSYCENALAEIESSKILEKFTADFR